MTTQTEMLREVLDAAVAATWALAHACEKDVTYRKAYDALSELTPKLRAALTQPEQPAPQGWKLVPGEALERWCAAFAEELSAWDIDPPLHHVKASHDEIAAMLAASPTPPQAEQAEAVKPRCDYPECTRACGDAKGFCHKKPEAAKPWPAEQQPDGTINAVDPDDMAPKPTTLSDFIRSDDSTRAAIGARVVDAAVEMQREVLAKPETERARLIADHLSDFHSHRDAWRNALNIAVAYAGNSDDASYWMHEVRAFDRAYAALLSADSKDAGEPVPADCDVRKIMLDVVPGWDGMGQEVYAKSVSEVEDLLTDMGQRLEDFELGLTRPQAADAQPLSASQVQACASNLADTILFDLQDRKGLLDGVDEATLQEIVAAHTSIIIDGLAVHGITGKDNAS